MGKKKLSRRLFVQQTSRLAIAAPVVGSLSSFAASSSPKDEGLYIPLRWIDEQEKTTCMGNTWGIPWPKGVLPDVRKIQVSNGNESIPTQSWITGRWPDGSAKWTAHSIPAGTYTNNLVLVQEQKETGHTALQVFKEKNGWTIDSGIIQIHVANAGHVLIPSLQRNNKVIGQRGRLVLQSQQQATASNTQALTTTLFDGIIEQAQLEQQGPVRAVVKWTGKHKSQQGRSWIPFTVRMYVYAGSDSIRLVHSIVFDGNEQQDFISGIGIRFDVPFDTPAYNRHVRFCGANGGVFAEAVQGLTGLRRDAGPNIRTAQIQGRAVPDSNSWPEPIRKGLPYIPQFGDYTLCQPTADGYSIKKRTGEQFGWIQSTAGHRALGTAYLGSPNGGLALGLRHFWQSHPAQIDIRDAHSTVGSITLWMWAPEAPAMDLRFYHDGMGQDSYEKQLAGLDITYEDYEPGFGTAMGIARTSELFCQVLAATPDNETLAQIAKRNEAPPQLLATSAYMKSAAAFAGFWSLPDLGNAAINRIDEQLDFYFAHYQQQVEQRRWYGFWHFGDVMHSYDTDRHVWKYDVGGFAWDNSELSTDLWLWFYFLRTGRADVFRFAEAMTRHTGEVDVHHLGKFAPLGSRHNVQHWGCSAKQLRISTVANRRIYYYLTADERVGDLMDEQVNAYKTLEQIAPGRKLPKGDVQQVSATANHVNMGFGTDWGSAAAAWLMHWERTGNAKVLTLLRNSMASIAAQPKGFFTGGAPMDIDNGKFIIDKTGKLSVSHLSAAFGLPEVCAELIQTFEDKAFEKAWLQYCRLYNASPNEQQAELGQALSKLNLAQGHSRLTAYAAQRLQDAALGKRAWQEFYAGGAGIRKPVLQTNKILPPVVMNAIDEAPGVSTNAVAQWGLAAMQCQACAGDVVVEK